jgi:superfamily II DNA or RNA helicase
MNMRATFGAVNLRDYQVESVDKLRDCFRAGARKVILAACTGFGKTESAIDLIIKSQHKGARCWFIVDRTTLVDQTSERFDKYGVDHGIIQADHWRTDYSKRVQIVSAQTLGRRAIIDLPDLIIVDECHEQRQPVLKLIEEAQSAKVIGLSATPFSAGMADHWESVISGTTVNKLIEQGYLVPLKIKACVAPEHVSRLTCGMRRKSSQANMMKMTRLSEG